MLTMSPHTSLVASLLVLKSGIRQNLSINEELLRLGLVNLIFEPVNNGVEVHKMMLGPLDVSIVSNVPTNLTEPQAHILRKMWFNELVSHVYYNIVVVLRLLLLHLLFLSFILAHLPLIILLLWLLLLLLLQDLLFIIMLFLNRHREDSLTLTFVTSFRMLSCWVCLI